MLIYMLFCYTSYYMIQLNIINASKHSNTRDASPEAVARGRPRSSGATRAACGPPSPRSRPAGGELFLASSLFLLGGWVLVGTSEIQQLEVSKSQVPEARSATIQDSRSWTFQNPRFW